MNKIKSVLMLPLLVALTAGVLTVPWQATATAAATSRFACDAKDSPDKGWVLPVYVYQPGQDAYGSDIDALLNTMWETDQTFDASAQRFGITRRIRYLQDAQCRPVVAKVPFVKGRNRAEMSKALQENLADQPARVRDLWPTKRVKPLFFVRDNDITNSCTGGGADAGLSNGGTILPRWCWSEAGLTHEFLHTFGLSHCNGGNGNGNDPLCRNWGKKPECTSDAASNYHLDSCRIDEFRYFEPTPVKQPPLAKNWNVAFSPYLIQDQPSPVWEFRIKVKESGMCLDGSGTEVTQRACAAGKAQTWQRSIDKDGYLTIRNAGTGRCLKMAPKVVTATCAKEPAQQWLPAADQEHTNFASRAGKELHVKGSQPEVLNEGGGTFIAELLGGKAAAPTPTASPTSVQTPTPTPSTRPTHAPTPTRTPSPETTPSTDPTPTPSPPTARNARFKEDATGACLTATRSKVRLGACRTTWRILPVANQAVQIRHKGRCLSAGPTSGGKRSIILSKCSKTATTQRWLLEPRSTGAVTLKIAATRATRLVGSATGVYAKAAYPGKALTFMIR